jgi:hypothetical protein
MWLCGRFYGSLLRGILFRLTPKDAKDNSSNDDCRAS